MQQPSLVAEAIPPQLLALRTRCEEGTLVVCVGAGVSRSPDAGLPLAASLSEALCGRLEGRLQGFEAPGDPTDIVAVADAAVEAAQDVAVLQQEILELAAFVSATPNLAHRAIALLLAEGVLDAALSWNWDTCIEKASPPGERIDVALSGEDVRWISSPPLVKVHGCASRPPTLLITSTQLADPPAWADQALHQKLVSGMVVFVGIGDVADYAQHRISLLLQDFPGLDIAVASPSVIANWGAEGFKWATVLPQLANDDTRRIALDADTFFDGLVRLWASQLLLKLRELRSQLEPPMPALDLIVESVGNSRALTLVEWARQSRCVPKLGTSAIRCPETVTLLVAAGVLAQKDQAETFALGPIASIDWVGRRVFAVAPGQNRPAPVIRQEIEKRAERIAERGLAGGQVEVLVAGSIIGSLETEFEASVPDIYGSLNPEDIFQGPTDVAIKVIHADPLVGADDA